MSEIIFESNNRGNYNREQWPQMRECIIDPTNSDFFEPWYVNLAREYVNFDDFERAFYKIYSVVKFEVTND